MTKLEIARRDVLLRMTGCSNPDCYACKSNRDAVDALVAAVREKQCAFCWALGGHSPGCPEEEAPASQILPNDQRTVAERETA